MGANNAPPSPPPPSSSASASEVIPKGFENLTPTLGAIVIGWMIMTALYGVSVGQCANYFNRYAHDPRNTKWTVIFLLLLETVHQALVSHAMYHQLITLRGDFHSLTQNIPTLMASVIPAMLTMGLIQYIWVMRIWTFNSHSKRTFFACCQSIVIVVDWGLALAWVITTWQNENSLASNPWLPGFAIILIAFTDLVNCTALSYLLYRTRNGLQRVDTMVKGLILSTLGTASLSCTFSVMLVIVVVLVPHDHWYIACFLVLSKLYFSSLLIMLNKRTPRPSMLRQGDAAPNVSNDALQLTTLSMPWGLKTEGALG